MIFKPHKYQEYAIDRIVAEDHVGLLLDMGLGKTAIMLSAISELIYDRLEVRRVLVIAPKKVSEATWQTEGRKWDNLSHLRFSTVLGTARARERALEADADIYVINRENVAWLCERYFRNGRADSWPFDMIVFDESSSFKNSQSARFKWIKRVLPKTRRTVILTGTPAPNGLEDLWAQIYLLDGGDRLGPNITWYRNRFFDYNPWRHELREKPGAYEAVQAKISDICVSMSAEDYLQLPEMVIDDIPVVLGTEARERYDALKRDMVMEIQNGTEAETELSVLSAAALTGKLLQLCGGSLYDPDGNVIEVHSDKERALEELLEGLHGAHCLLFYGYKHELERIQEAAKNAGYKRVRVLDGAADVDAWNAGSVELLIAHPASTAYGLNLQTGGHHIIWYTLTWNLELYQQANARLHRQGQTMPTIVHRLIVDGCMDSAVKRALEGKSDVQAELLNYLKAEIRGVK